MDNKKIYPIGYVARATGLSQHVIRVWERRYGAVHPERAGKSRRFYSQSDIDHLKLLRDARSKGQRIGAAVALDEAKLADVLRANGASPDWKDYKTRTLARVTDSSRFLDQCLDAAGRLDSKALASALRRAGAYLSRPFLLNGVIAPLMHRIGEAWADGSLRIIHEHGASNVVKGFLWDLIGNAAGYTDAPAMVVATPAGQICEIGAMIATLTAADCGWNAFYFGPNLPAEEIAAAALHERAAAVALSIACAMRPESIEQELLSLKQSLGSAVDLFIGGRAARAHQAAVVSAGGRYFESLYEFAEFILQIN